jgi:hypothetical protein
MNEQPDDDTDTDNTEDFTTADPVLVALELCRIASNPKTIASAVKRLRRLDRQYAETEVKCAALAAQAEQTATALEERAAELAARETALDKRESEFAISIEETRDHLRGYYDSIAEADRHLRYRILSHADLLHGYNAQLQDLPSWPQIRQLVVGLPPDPPSLGREVVSPPRIDVFSDTSNDPHADRHGNVFLGSLSRDVSHKQGAT